MANPIISRAEFTVSNQPLTARGVANKTAFLLAISVISALAFFGYCVSARISYGFINAMSLGSILLAFGLSVFIGFRPHMAKTLAIPFAILEGVVVGAISLFTARLDPSLPVTAMLSTFATGAVMLALYRARVIKVTQKFRSIMVSAILAVMVVYLLQIFLSVFFHNSIPGLFDGGALAIGFSLFVVVLASFSLLLDFDNIERAQAAGVDESYEWVLGVGVLSTLIWMYLEITRLLGYLQD